MSTLTGQSDRQPLHDRHRSSASRTSVERQPSVTTSPCQHLPEQVGPTARGEPSRHGSPDSSGTSRHRWTACTCRSPHSAAGPARSRRRRRDRRTASTTFGPWPARGGGSPRPAAGGSTMIPGFITWRGSQMRFISASSASPSPPYIRPSSSERARPSPCSPETDPPSDTTRSVASSTNDRYAATPLSLSRSKSIRMCMQPSPKCPYEAPDRPYLPISSSRPRR